MGDHSAIDLHTYICTICSRVLLAIIIIIIIVKYFTSTGEGGGGVRQGLMLGKH